MQVMSTFCAGDHIKVNRRLYAHHGIYVNDDRVIDFSGGHNIFEKLEALVQVRTLKEFEGKYGRAEKVKHPGKFLGGIGFWPGADWEYSSEEVVKRAEALSQVATTRGAYRLSGSNCEHIANWCKTGAHESKQVRYVHAGLAVTTFALSINRSRKTGNQRAAPMAVTLGLSVLTAYMQYEAWTTPKRWMPIIAEAEKILRNNDGSANAN